MHDFVFKGDDLVVATHGRSIWVLEDLPLLRQHRAEMDAAPLHVYEPRRQVRWATEHGFPAQGYDASEGLLAEARRLHPHLRFDRALLPELAGVADNHFVNVMCETVIMHLAAGEVAPSATCARTVRRAPTAVAPSSPPRA